MEEHHDSIQQHSCCHGFASLEHGDWMHHMREIVHEAKHELLNSVEGKKLETIAGILLDGFIMSMKQKGEIQRNNEEMKEKISNVFME